jgi:hypothetical protein
MFACSGAFYAFYAGDELQVCRVSVTESVLDATRATSPGFDGSASAGYPDVTVGLLSGYGTSTYSCTYWTAKFSIGGTSFDGMVLGYDVGGRETTVDGKSMGTELTPYSYYQQAAHTLVYDVGYPPWDTGVFSGEGTIFNGPVVVEFDRTVSDFGDIRTGYFAFIVPKYDSESVYVKAYRDQTIIKRAGVTQRAKANDFGYRYGFTPVGGVFSGWQYKWYGAGATTSWDYSLVLIGGPTARSDTTTLTVLQDDELVISKGGARPATIPGVSLLQLTGVEDVGIPYTTYSGTSSSDPLIISGENHVSVGIPQTVTEPVLVGWV